MARREGKLPAPAANQLRTVQQPPHSQATGAPADVATSVIDVFLSCSAVPLLTLLSSRSHGVDGNLTQSQRAVAAAAAT